MTWVHASGPGLGSLCQICCHISVRIFIVVIFVFVMRVRVYIRVADCASDRCLRERDRDTVAELQGTPFHCQCISNLTCNEGEKNTRV